jgi:hypothetical protein
VMHSRTSRRIRKLFGFAAEIIDRMKFAAVRCRDLLFAANDLLFHAMLVVRMLLHSLSLSGDSTTVVSQSAHVRPESAGFERKDRFLMR